MPELPELEYTRRNLERWMRGARIEQVTTDDARIVRPLKPRAFERALAGRTVERVQRRGKWLKLTLDDGRFLFLHLGMSGWLELGKPGDAPLRFERVRFELARGGRPSRLVYLDLRRWGRMIVADEDIPVWTSLGPDPLDDGIDLDRLEEKLAHRKSRSIKEVLLDQKVLAGVGNIQAIEALWKAGIHPRSKASAMTREDLRAIARGLRWTIARTLVDLEKGTDEGESPFRVYGRKGEPCPRCGHPLEAFVLGGRTTMACPNCQVLRGGRATPRRAARP